MSEIFVAYDLLVRELVEYLLHPLEIPFELLFRRLSATSSRSWPSSESTGAEIRKSPPRFARDRRVLLVEGNIVIKYSTEMRISVDNLLNTDFPAANASSSVDASMRA